MSSSETTSPAWEQKLLRNPHEVADKRSRVRRMFAAIAPSYDLNNRLHSLWQDQRWRRKAVKLAELKPDDVVVDVACGTGDLVEAFRQAGGQGSTQPTKGGEPDPKYIGIDFTFEMLPIAQGKSALYDMASTIRYVNGDAQALPLADGCCDVVSIAFGIRNVQDPAKALREFHRVLRPGGRVIVLEFSLPTNRVLRRLYNLYFRRVLPRTATWISGDTTGAYRYLPESVNTFIGPEQIVRMMQDAGFEAVRQVAMSFGVCICYRGIKH